MAVLRSAPSSGLARSAGSVVVPRVRCCARAPSGPGPSWLPLGTNWLSSPSLVGSPGPASTQGGGNGGMLSRGSTRGFGNGPRGLYSVAAAAAGGPFAQAGTQYQDPPRVCILGGGFGGLYTAVRLESLMWPGGTKPQVTLIDINDRFIFKPMLYEILNESVQPWEVAPRFDKLLEPHAVRFIQGQVESVEPKDAGSARGGGGRVLLKDGEPVEYDWLVLALGADATPRGVPGVKELTIPFVTFDDAMKVRSHLEVLERGSGVCVTVVGAGYSGVELAVAVAERLGSAGSVRLVTPSSGILPGAPAGQRESAEKVISALDITVMTGERVKSVEQAEAQPGRALTKRQVKLIKDASGKETVLEADLVLWTGGCVPLTNETEDTFRPKPSGPGLPFPRNDRGATETEPTLRVVNHGRVFALGDVSTVQANGEPLPQTAQVAFQQADYVAWNLWASINDRPLLPFRYQHLGSMMSLGKASGAVSVPIPLPPPLSSAVGSGQVGQFLQAVGVKVNTSGVTLEGVAGGLARRAAYWYRQPTSDHRNRVGLSWLSQVAKDATDMASTAGISTLLGALQSAGRSSDQK